MTLQDAALAYAAQGRKVFPLHEPIDGECSCRHADCTSPAKHPKTKHGLNDATSDQETIREWWGKWPQANIGLLMGDGLLAVDVDPDKGGDESIRDLGDLPDTVTGLTGGGGRHLIYHSDADYPNRAGIAPGVDIRSEGGYIVAPPSQHVSGGSYEWEVDHAPGEMNPAPLPAVLRRLLQNGHAPAPEVGEQIPEGERNSTLASLGGTMRRRGMEEAEISAALLAVNTNRCAPPLPEHEVQDIAKSVSRYAPGEMPKHTATPPSDNGRSQPYEAPPSPALPHECLRGTFADWVSMWKEYEGTDAFDFIAILAAFGITLGRRVRIDYANPTFANFYACFYGPTNTSKKSSAIARGVDLALSANPSISRIGGLLSAEGLLQRIGHDPTDDKAPPRPRQKALMELEEFRVLLAKARQEGAGGLIPFLTQLWDCRPEYSLTVRRCPIVSVEPTVSILAASTAEWLEAGLVDADTYGGFTNRWLFITGPMRPLNPLPPDRDQRQWTAIVKQLHEVSDTFKMDTKVILSEPAAANWRSFYLDFHGQDWGTETVAKVIQRVPVYVMKIAMLYTADRGESTVTAEDMEAAISFGQFAVNSAATLFADISGTRSAKLERLIRRHVETAGGAGLSRRTLHQRVGGRYSSHEFNQAVDAMLKTGELNARGDSLTLSGVSANVH